MTCDHCSYEFTNKHPEDHPDECCDCFDLANGKPLSRINERRAESQEPPIPPQDCEHCGRWRSRSMGCHEGACVKKGPKHSPWVPPSVRKR